MDADVLKMLAHIDQTRSAVREMLRQLSDKDIAALIRVCAKGDVHTLDERERLLVGILAVTAIFDLRLDPLDEI